MNTTMQIPQAVILAAGKGKRFWPLTLTRPKPLLKILDKAVLEHNLDQLNDLVKEVILVIGYRGEKIKEFFGSGYKNLKIKYVSQNSQTGTGDAAKKALPLIKDKILLLNGDDLYDKEDIKKCLKKFPCVLLARVNPVRNTISNGVKDASNFGVVRCQGKLVKEIQEKPKKPDSNLVNTGLYFLPKSILNSTIKKSARGEYEFTDCLCEFIKRKKLFFVEAKNWRPLSCPWNLLEAANFLLKKEKEIRKGRIEKNAFLKGKIIIKKGALIRAGSRLEGPIYIGEDSQIGPNCLIRGPVSIGKRCLIGQSVEIKNSVIGDDCKIPHLSYVGDSIIGQGCNLGAGTIVANLRLDNQTIKLTIDGKIIDTKLQKFGCVLGDNVKTGVNSSLMPGVLVGSNSIVGPNSVVFENVDSDTKFYSKFQGVKKKKQEYHKQ